MKVRKAALHGVLGAIALASITALAQDRPARPGRVILDEAPLDKVVRYSHSDVTALFRRAYNEHLGVVRMLEGGEFNVNIRHFQDVTPESFSMLTHPDTIDVWVVQEGTGTIAIGGERVGDRYVGTEEFTVGVGDLVFIPAGIPHGVKESKLLTFFNIRFPEHRN